MPNVSLLLKFAAGGALIGSVFYLALEGKVPVDSYMSLVTVALGALGYHAASTIAPKT